MLRDTGPSLSRRISLDTIRDAATHVFVPPFLKRLPFEEEITTGLLAEGVIIVGACAKAPRGAAAAAIPAAVLVTTNSRRLIFLGIENLRPKSTLLLTGWRRPITIALCAS